MCKRRLHDCIGKTLVRRPVGKSGTKAVHMEWLGHIAQQNPATYSNRGNPVAHLPASLRNILPDRRRYIDDIIGSDSTGRLIPELREGVIFKDRESGERRSLFHLASFSG